MMQRLLFPPRLPYACAMLAFGNFQNTLFLAVLVGWIMSVILHEFAHGIVAYWGGDYTIRERGGLTLNPFQYVDPLMTIVLPVVFLLLGGVPLPGGATQIRRDLLRNRAWESAVSLAGPIANILIFLACVLPLHPRFGWLHVSNSAASWTQAQLLLAGRFGGVADALHRFESGPPCRRWMVLERSARGFPLRFEKSCRSRPGAWG